MILKGKKGLEEEEGRRSGDKLKYWFGLLAEWRKTVNNNILLYLYKIITKIKGDE